MKSLRNAVVGSSVLLGLCLTAYGQRPSEIVKSGLPTQQSQLKTRLSWYCLPQLVKMGGMSHALSQPPGGLHADEDWKRAGLGAPFAIEKPVQEPQGDSLSR